MAAGVNDAVSQGGRDSQEVTMGEFPEEFTINIADSDGKLIQTMHH